MRKFKELDFVDKLNMYHWIIQVPIFVILFLLAAYEIDYSVICYLFATTIIGDLIFFGILDSQKNYSYYNLILDAFYLFIATFLATFFAAPYILSLMSRFELLPTTSFWINYVSLLISILILYLFWYIIILIQKIVYPDVGNWKWECSGLFNSTKKLRLR